VGRLVFGFLGGYVREEGMKTGTRYFLLDLVRRVPGLHHLSVFLYLLVMAVAFGALAFWSWKVSNEAQIELRDRFWIRSFHLPERAAFLPGALFLALAMMLAFSPHYAWYVAWLIPFGVLLPNITVFAYALGLFYLATTPLGAGTTAAQFHLNCVLYSVVCIVAVFELIIRARRTRRSAPKSAGST
jgi:hypothetical protein